MLKISMLVSVIRVEDIPPSDGSHKSPSFKGGMGGGLPVKFMGKSPSPTKIRTAAESTLINQSWGSRATHPCLPLRAPRRLGEGSPQPCWPVKTFSACTRRRLDINSLNCFARQPPGAEIRAPRPIFISERGGEKKPRPLPQPGRPSQTSKGVAWGWGALATEICTLTGHATHPTTLVTPRVLGNLGSRATPPRVRETKAGGRPPESHRWEARPGKPIESLSLEPNSSAATESHRASSTSRFLWPRSDNRANSVTGDRRAPSAGLGAGLPRLISTPQKPGPSGGRSSRPCPAPRGWTRPPPAAPPAAGRAAGSEGQAAGLGLRPAPARPQPHLCSAPAHLRTPARTPSPGCGWPAADPARSRPWLPAPRSARAPGDAGSRPAR